MDVESKAWNGCVGYTNRALGVFHTKICLTLPIASNKTVETSLMTA